MGRPGKPSSTIPNMPALQISRQPDALAWFSSLLGQPVLSAELPIIRSVLASRPAQQPWLWIAPIAAGGEGAFEAPARSLLLHRQGSHLSGSLRCGLPLPLPNESIGNLIIQHALDDGSDGLLEECERVLEPGGRLWLFTLNAWSPYRARWRRSGLMARNVLAWQRELRGLGLQPCGKHVSYLGPAWRAATTSPSIMPNRLRAVCLMETEKRTAALIPPAPVKRQWQAGAATA